MRTSKSKAHASPVSACRECEHCLSLADTIHAVVSQYVRDSDVAVIQTKVEQVFLVEDDDDYGAVLIPLKFDHGDLVRRGDPIPLREARRVMAAIEFRVIGFVRTSNRTGARRNGIRKRIARERRGRMEGPIERLEQVEVVESLRSALTQLRAEERQVLELRYVCGLSRRQIIEQYSLSTKAIRNHEKNALNHLRCRLGALVA